MGEELLQISPGLDGFILGYVDAWLQDGNARFLPCSRVACRWLAFPEPLRYPCRLCLIELGMVMTGIIVTVI